MSELVIQVPDRTTPGYPRRIKRLIELQRAFRSFSGENPDPAVLDTVIEGLLPYVAEPTDPDAAREALWDASQAQFEEVLAALTGTPLSEPASATG